MILKIKKIILLIQKLFLRYENPDQDIIARCQGLSTNAPIFIVGAPRTGSTLLFQILSCYTKVTYISNLMALFPRYMAFIHRLTKHRIDSNKDVKNSNYGIISGLHSPNEASKIFDFWIFNSPSSIITDAVKTTVYKISKQSKRPLLVKSMGVSLKLDTLMEYFPNAKIIFIKRDAFNTAKSILKARLDINGDVNTWWSLKPKGYEKVLDMNPQYQVLWQIDAINKQIEKDLYNFKYVHVTIDYQALCQNPIETIDLICCKLGLEKKGNKVLTAKVKYSEGKSATTAENELLLKESEKFVDL